MDIVDILYEIKFNETNFTLIKEIIEYGLTEYWFQSLTIFYMFFMLIKCIEMDHYFEKQMNLLVVRFDNKIEILEKRFENDMKFFTNSLTNRCNELIEDSETGETRFCKNHPKEDSYLHDEKISEDDDDDDNKCIKLIKDSETGETRFCKNYLRKGSNYCNMHHKKIFEDDEEFNSLITSSSEEI